MNNAPNENSPAAFEAPRAQGADRKWLEAAVEDIKKVYALGKQNENPFSLPLPWETKAKIKALKKAQKVLEEGGRGEINKPTIEVLEQNCTALNTRLRLTKKARGPQMDFVLDFCVFYLAEVLKAKTGAHNYNWVLIAEVITTKLNRDISPNQALKVHKRFKALRKDKEKYRGAVIANAKFLITRTDVKQGKMS